ncbi:hypothetical protein PRIPAC_97018 [Pristionchus pacificus]|uniref:Uncharacterized protein n=1 Tax=Pristionchus pacificus TaxID=54126 RepID=A0A2A6BCX4_PRIPA|nr:hypothetical protein PRIPAC_97018 [Pristionchus pacificus]|eukprot:PDM63735.1 hypothetical protein PRIPAC_49708 [Pristionchus pacificus]
MSPTMRARNEETEESGSSIVFLCYREGETGKELVRPAESWIEKWHRVDKWMNDTFSRTTKEGGALFERDQDVERFDRIISVCGRGI